MLEESSRPEAVTRFYPLVKHLLRPKAQDAPRLSGSQADSRGLGPRLRINQVKQTSNHGDDHDAKYQP